MKSSWGSIGKKASIGFTKKSIRRISKMPLERQTVAMQKLSLLLDQLNLSDKRKSQKDDSLIDPKIEKESIAQISEFGKYLQELENEQFSYKDETPIKK